MTTPGRPTKHTPAREKTILAHLERGVGRAIAARLALIDPSTLANWIRQDPELQRKVEYAEAVAEQRAMERIQEEIEKEQGKGQWTAAAWFLERTNQARYALGGGARGGGEGTIPQEFADAMRAVLTARAERMLPLDAPEIVDGEVVAHPEESVDLRHSERAALLAVAGKP